MSEELHIEMIMVMLGWSGHHADLELNFCAWKECLNQ